MKPVLAFSRNVPRLRIWFRWWVERFFFAPRGFWKLSATLGADVNGLWVGSGTGPEAHPDPIADGVMLYFHGGGFLFGRPDGHAKLVSDLAQRCGLAAYLPRYSLAPEHPFPKGTEDALTAYLALLDMGVPAEKIVIAGDSSGGNFALVLLARILRDGLAKPRATVAICPPVDLTFSSPSIKENAWRDAYLPARQTLSLTEHYLAGRDPRDPAASPLYADFTGAPPVLLHACTSEILRDDSRRMEKALKTAGVDCTLRMQQGAFHVWHIMRGVVPEADEALDHIAKWLAEHPV